MQPRQNYEKLPTPQDPSNEPDTCSEQYAQKQSTSSHFYKLTTIGLTIIVVVLGTLQIAMPRTITIQNTAQQFSGLTCGNSVDEAVALGCEFDLLAKAWLPRSCTRHGLEEFVAAGKPFSNSDSNATWVYWSEKGGGRQMGLEELAALGDGAIDGVRWWSTSREHSVHCAWMLLRLAHAYANGLRSDHLTRNYKHSKHCVNMLLEKSMHAPGSDEIITKGNVVFGSC